MIGLRLRRALRRLRPEPVRPAILMYHRVASPPVDPWGLAVALERFRDQLDALARRRAILPMDAFVAALKERRLPACAVALTFDDGYRDNVTRAAPVLAAKAAPATVFLTAGAIGGELAFWWDELARMILLQRSQIRYDLVVGGRQVGGDLPAMAPGEAPDPAWRAWQPPRTAREAAYVELWRLLQRVQPVQRADAMEALRRAIPPVPADHEELPMTGDEVARLAAAGIAIGAHAVTHQPLTTLAAAERRAEIETSRSVCRDLVRGPVCGFAYPHGDRDIETIAMVREAGYSWACSTRGALVDPEDYNRFDLPRLVARDVSGAALLRQIEEARP